IPIADRQALIEADERAHREAEEEDEHRHGRRRSRHRNSRRRDRGERVRSEIVEHADAGTAPPADHDHPHEGEAHAETAHHDHEGHDHGHEHEYGHEAHDTEQAHAHDDHHDHDHAGHPDDAASAAPADDHHAETPVAAAVEASVATALNEPLAPEFNETDGHDELAEEERVRENVAHADDAPHDEHAGAEHTLAPEGEQHIPAPAGDAIHDEDEDGEEAEEEVVESVGGDDVLEEVPERAFRPRRQYKIQEVIKRRQVMLVQVVKEERGNKGAALTTYLSLAGRYAVLMPNTARGGGISRKITSAQDRMRLKEVVQDLDVPDGMGIILRNAGASRTKPEIKRDFEYLIRMWETVRDMTLKSQAPTLVYEEGSLIKRSLRDLYNKEIDEILVAGEAGYQEARDFMKMLMPSNVRAVKQYRDGQPLFSRMGVESQLDAMFSPTVQLRSGGYVVINQTEALVSIDVNSGRSTREH